MSRWISNQLEFSDAGEVMEYFYQEGWTDGLPIVPPTPQKVEAMLEAVHMQGREVIGAIPERNREVTSEKVAINAVMAGCLPVYMPVVLAAVQAVLDPPFGAHGVTSSTAGASILIVVNGPVSRQIKLNSGKNLFGMGHRSNATIGRALSLTLRNAAASGLFDQSTLGHPGKISFCIAEAEREEWQPLHVERGWKREQSTVTVIATEGPNQVNNHIAETPEAILLTIADRMASVGRLHMQRPLPQTPCAVLICPEHLTVLLRHGWDKAQIREFLYEHSMRSEKDLYNYGQSLVSPGFGEEVKVPLVPSADDIYVLAGGGNAGRFSAIIPCWGNKRQSQPVTKEVTSSGFT